MNLIPTIGANLHTQDNRITANPIFLVQQKHRTGGFEESYADQHVWIRDGEEVDDVIAALLDEADKTGSSVITHPDDEDRLDKTVREVDDYRKVYYRDEYVFVQPFFTEHGAQEYIRANGHNLREPRIYVESGYRNAEWAAVREYLMAQAKEGWKS